MGTAGIVIWDLGCVISFNSQPNSTGQMDAFSLHFAGDRKLGTVSTVMAGNGIYSHGWVVLEWELERRLMGARILTWPYLGNGRCWEVTLGMQLRWPLVLK